MSRPPSDDELQRLAEQAASETHKDEIEAGEHDEPVYSLEDLREVGAPPSAGERGRKCPRCGTVVSARRLACDECGYSLRRAPDVSARRLLLWALLLAGAIALISAIGFGVQRALREHSWAGQYEKALDWEDE
ncbi:MAG: hypothetical protein ACE5O2_12695 [Armatimonadota bacterium]